jgi:hypothetical protein
MAVDYAVFERAGKRVCYEYPDSQGVLRRHGADESLRNRPNKKLEYVGAIHALRPSKLYQKVSSFSTT